MTKLTLSVDGAVVAKAKELAAASGISVSAMFTQFVLSKSAPAASDRIGPLTRKVSGMIEVPADVSDRQLLTDALADRYGMNR